MTRPDPPVEWVGGDPLHVAQFAGLLGAILGAAVLLAVELILQVANVLPLPAPVTHGIWFSQAVLLVLIPLEFGLLFIFPRRYPIIAKLGISPKGLTVRFPFPYGLGGPVRWDWPLVMVGPGWVTSANASGWGRRYRLTEAQMSRLANFLRIPDPAGFGRPNG